MYKRAYFSRYIHNLPAATHSTSIHFAVWHLQNLLFLKTADKKRYFALSSCGEDSDLHVPPPGDKNLPKHHLTERRGLVKHKQTTNHAQTHTGSSRRPGGRPGETGPNSPGRSRTRSTSGTARPGRGWTGPPPSCC